MHAPCRTVIVAVVTWQQARTLVNYVQPQGLGTPTLQLALRSMHGVVNQGVCCTSNGITCALTLTVCGGGYGHVRGVKDCCTHLVWRACVHVLRHGGLLFIRWQWVRYGKQGMYQLSALLCECSGSWWCCCFGVPFEANGNNIVMMHGGKRLLLLLPSSA